MRKFAKPKLVFNVSQADYDATIKARNVVMADYNIQENAIKKVVAGCPGLSLEDVLAKASIINDFYSTSILDVFTVAKNVFSIITKIGIINPDNSGNCNAVMKMAEVHHGIKKYNHISFASKFASFYRPDLFPIYDFLVADAFCRLRRKGFFISNCKFSASSLKKDYCKYKLVYDEFIELSGMDKLNNGTSTLTYKDIDNYIWTSRKVIFAVNGKYTAKVDISNKKQIGIILTNILNRSI